MCRRYMCRRTVCVRGVVVKMLGIELLEEVSYLVCYVCMYIRIRSHVSHISYTYMNRHSYVCIISLVLFL